MPLCQSAYRAGYFTETALVKVQSDNLLNMDHQKVAQLVLIDLSLDLDTEDHDILLNIMNCTWSIRHHTKLVLLLSAVKITAYYYQWYGA